MTADQPYTVHIYMTGGTRFELNVSEEGARSWREQSSIASPGVIDVVLSDRSMMIARARVDAIMVEPLLPEERRLA